MLQSKDTWTGFERHNWHEYRLGVYRLQECLWEQANAHCVLLPGEHNGVASQSHGARLKSIAIGSDWYVRAYCDFVTISKADEKKKDDSVLLLHSGNPTSSEVFKIFSLYVFLENNCKYIQGPLMLPTSTSDANSLHPSQRRCREMLDKSHFELPACQCTADGQQHPDHMHCL